MATGLVRFCYHLFCANLTRGGVIWEEDPQLRKRLHQIACRQVFLAFSWLRIDVGGPSPVWMVLSLH